MNGWRLDGLKQSYAVVGIRYIRHFTIRGTYLNESRIPRRTIIDSPLPEIIAS
jgi:hypothetical protein